MSWFVSFFMLYLTQMIPLNIYNYQCLPVSSDAETWENPTQHHYNYR